MAGDTPPPNFNGGLLYVLPKKPTNLVEDTRPLVVNNTDNRIISTCIRESITPSIDSILSPDQHGFRANMSVDSNIEYFNEKFYSAMDNSKFYDVMLVDFKKAFDSISHDAIFQLIKKIGLYPLVTVTPFKPSSMTPTVSPPLTSPTLFALTSTLGSNKAAHSHLHFLFF